MSTRMGFEPAHDEGRPTRPRRRRALVAALAGVANLSGLLAARYGPIEELAECASLLDGCEGQAVLAPLVRAFGVALVVGVIATWLVALTVAAFGRIEIGISIRRLSGALAVYAVAIVLSAVGLVFVPFGLYVVLALFLIGPPVAVFLTIDDRAPT